MFCTPVGMPSILVVYGTTHGHTAKVAEAVAKTIEAGGASCDVMAAAAATRSPADYDGVVVAASVHAGQYQKAVTDWVRAHRVALGGRPTAFISVCLGVLQKDPKVDRDLQGFLERFFSETGWHPHVTTIVAGAYRWFLECQIPSSKSQAPTHSQVPIAQSRCNLEGEGGGWSSASPHLVRVSGISAG